MADANAPQKYDLIVNKQHHDWPTQIIKGSDVLTLAGSPSDWVVNLQSNQPGEDPEIGPNQEVDLDHKAEPKGIKKFTTRKPKTSPGK